MASSHGQRLVHPPPSPPPDRQSKRRRVTAAGDAIEFGTAATMGMAFAPTMASSPLVTPPPMASAHHYHHQQQQQQQQQHNGQQHTLPFMPRSRSQASSLRVANCTLEDALLALPPNLSPPEHIRRQAAIAQELAHQEDNPPILPPSQVQDLPPKPFIPEFLKFPADLTDAQRRDIEARNNKIAAEHQRVDRQRNNQAAKKSRQARLEALGNTRELLNATAAELAWFRMKVLSMGGSVDEWEMVPQVVKDRMVREIENRVKAVDDERLEAKKREEVRKRAERNRRRAEERNAAAGQGGLEGEESYHLPELFGDEEASSDEVKMEDEDDEDDV